MGRTRQAGLKQEGTVSDAKVAVAAHADGGSSDREGGGGEGE